MNKALAYRTLDDAVTKFWNRKIRKSLVLCFFSEKRERQTIAYSNEQHVLDP